ncbi:MAG: hypothetical protein J6P05_01865 [Lachnospiraceae bacterium]|nr:hypothetical protein [Lachnospiraceae bacterium]
MERARGRGSSRGRAPRRLSENREKKRQEQRRRIELRKRRELKERKRLDRRSLRERKKLEKERLKKERRRARIEAVRERRRRIAERRKIRRFRRNKHRIDTGLLIFGLIAAYIVAIIVSSAQETRVTGYEVKKGSLAVNKAARGVAIRDEIVKKAEASGYINYYARESERVSNGALVCSIDETGRLSEILQENQSISMNLTDKDLLELKTSIMNFRKSFYPSNFRTVYDFKYTAGSTIEKLVNANVLETLRGVSNNGTITSTVNMEYADDAGVVVYSTDGLESVKADMVNKFVFDEQSHMRDMHNSNTIVSENENAFKIIRSENWSIVVPWDESWNSAEETGDSGIEDGKYINVRFLKNGYTAWALMTIHHLEDGDYLELSFNNSMITFATDRYIDIELLTNEKDGLKIPRSAIVDKDFYLVPEEYLTRGGDSDSDGFIRETYLESGEKSTEFVKAEVYDKIDGMYYVDTKVFSSGDVLIKPDSTEQYTVSEKTKLTGVYNMNSGYADFRKINLLYANKEYAIVESGTMYGLNVYDHIVLNGKDVEDKDFFL